MPTIRVHDEVGETLRAGRPVVALETAVLTHGLPRTPVEIPDLAGWDARGPAHLTAIRAMQEAVRRGGAVPAAIGVLDGTLHIGLEEAALERLSAASRPRKATVTNLAAVLASGDPAGTTVSATLAACGRVDHGPIPVLATGGLGGVHHGWSSHPDVSADLRQLASTAVCVVCSGPKSVLDVAATVELMESLGIPLLGYRTDAAPRFCASGTDAIGVTRRVDGAEEAARVCRTHWSVLASTTAVVLANPVPPLYAVDAGLLEDATRAAEAAAGAAGVTGAARTPFLLDTVATLTEGRSLTANLALLLDNASLAAAVASALASGP